MMLSSDLRYRYGTNSTIRIVNLYQVFVPVPCTTQYPLIHYGQSTVQYRTSTVVVPSCQTEKLPESKRKADGMNSRLADPAWPDDRRAGPASLADDDVPDGAKTDYCTLRRRVSQPSIVVQHKIGNWGNGALRLKFSCMPARAPALSAGCPFRPGLTAARSFRPPRPSDEGTHAAQQHSWHPYCSACPLVMSDGPSMAPLVEHSWNQRLRCIPLALLPAVIVPL